MNIEIGKSIYINKYQVSTQTNASLPDMGMGMTCWSLPCVLPLHAEFHKKHT